MRPVLTLAVLAAACGPSRDPTFNRIVQFSAVTKLQVVGNDVYTFESTGFERVPKKGGTVETLLTDGAVHDFAVTPAAAFVATDTGLIRVDLGTGAAQTAFTNEKTVAVAADGYGVSWLSCTALNHAALDGSNRVSTPLESCTGAALLALDSSTAYGSGASGDWYASRSGGPVTIFGTTPCFRVQAGGGWMYCGSDGLKRLNPLTGELEHVIDGDVRDFALSPVNVYASVGQDLTSQPRGGGSPYVLGTLADITAVAIDAELVYFVNTDGALGLLLSTAL